MNPLSLKAYKKGDELYKGQRVKNRLPVSLNMYKIILQKDIGREHQMEAKNLIVPSLLKAIQLLLEDPLIPLKGYSIAL